MTGTDVQTDVQSNAQAEVQDLIGKGQYRKILELTCHNREKIIAFIKLERYHEGLLFIRGLKKNSDVIERLEALRLTGDYRFEEAYILYKLKKYRKSLKILKGLDESERRNVLLSQVLYFLGKYEKAYEILAKCEYEKERDINLLAMEVLHGNSLQNGISKSKKNSEEEKDSEKDDDKLSLSTKFGVNYDFGNLSNVAEYNRSFLDYKSYKQSEYVGKYHKTENKRIEQQVGNLLGLLPVDTLKGKKKQIVEYNKGNIKKIRRELIQKDTGRLVQIFHRNEEIMKLKDEDLKNVLLYLKNKKKLEDVKESVDKILGNKQ